MQNHFQLFDIPEKYTISLSSVDRSYFALMQECHPDKFVGKSAIESLRAMQKTAQVNDAYHVLKSPLLRAEYLLAQNNILVNKDENSVKPNSEILIDSMERREALSECDNKKSLLDMENSALDSINEAIFNISEGFEQGKLDITVQFVIKLRYLNKFLEEIKVKRKKVK